MKSKITFISTVILIIFCLSASKVFGQSLSDYQYIKSTAYEAITNGQSLVKPFSFEATSIEVKNYWLRDLNSFSYYNFLKGDTLIGVYFIPKDGYNSPYHLTYLGKGFLIVPPFVSIEIQKSNNPYSGDDKFKYGLYQSALFPNLSSPYTGDYVNCGSGIYPSIVERPEADSSGCILIELKFALKSSELDLHNNEIDSFEFIEEYTNPKGERFLSTIKPSNVLTDKQTILGHLNNSRRTTYIDDTNVSNQKVLLIVFE